MKKVLVVAPHPDDESLGCGGTLLRHKKQGDNVAWLIMTRMSECAGYTSDQINQREQEIIKAKQRFQFSTIYQLPFPCAQLDRIPLSEIITMVSTFVASFEPNIIYLPYPGDVHSDHTVTFNVMSAVTKRFRYPSVQRILCYEALSETDFSINPSDNGFKPNVFVNIDDFIEEKINIISLYQSEIMNHPFPRSSDSIRALALLRGATANFDAAEAFMLLKEYEV